MEEGPIQHPGVEENVYHAMGPKTLWIFILQRVQAASIFFILAIGFLMLNGQPFLKKTPVGDITNAMALATWGAFGVFAIVFLFTLLIGWLVYHNYRFMLGPDALKIKKGILNKEETAIPYRQIQNVVIKRDLSYQMLGLSRIEILTAGEEDEPDEDSEGILPALDKDLAEWFQAELLKRANVQKVVES